ncbi:MAG TPA: TIGR00282 family metallophosphoesterase [Rectinemataceae bacterium]
MSLRVVFIGEIVGKTGVFALKSCLPEIRSRFKPDFIMAGADSATGGAGLGVQHAVYLRKLGVHCLTMGDSAYYKTDMTEFYPKAPWVLRPANLPYENPGKGWKIFETEKGSVAVISLLGQVGFSRVHGDNPFRCLDQALERISRLADTILVDFHATATAEKLTMAAYADGRVSLVSGTHGLALTADARVSPKGTALLTDAGRTGSALSVGGMDPDAKVKEFMSAIRVWEGDGKLGLETQGIFAEIDERGRAMAAEGFRISCQEKMRERDGDS